MRIVKKTVNRVMTAWLAKKYPIQSIDVEKGYRTEVDLYWGKHIVNPKPFRDASQSEQYIEWRFSIYPLFREFSQLYGVHDD